MDRERLAENLLTFVPLIHKKLMKSLPNLEISRQQIELLFRINKEDERPMSYYSEKMMIPKSHLTLLSARLIEGGLIERVSDPDDRRIIILKITEKGKGYLLEYKNEIIQKMVNKLELLDDSDIKRLNGLIEEMKIILDKIEQ